MSSKLRTNRLDEPVIEIDNADLRQEHGLIFVHRTAEVRVGSGNVHLVITDIDAEGLKQNQKGVFFSREDAMALKVMLDDAL